MSLANQNQNKSDQTPPRATRWPIRTRINGTNPHVSGFAFRPANQRIFPLPLGKSPPRKAAGFPRPPAFRSSSSSPPPPIQFENTPRTKATNPVIPRKFILNVVSNSVTTPLDITTMLDITTYKLCFEVVLKSPSSSYSLKCIAKLCH